MGLGERSVDAARTAGRRVLRELIVPALPHTRPETIKALIESAHLRTVLPQERIYRQGDPVELTLILDGHLAFQRTTVDGQHLMTGVARTGDLFGWSSMAPIQSSVELVALTRCRLAQWDGPEIRALASDDPALALDAVESLAGSLHALVERIEGFLHQDSRRRVLRILARHRDLFFSEPPVLTRGHLPGLVGTSREMTGAVLRRLEREGIVAREGRSGLRLLRPDRLKAGAGTRTG
jgi:CRP/FNR family cyclic AMP-dependent transcriptional regulator